jgi:hypothetical protein
MLKKIYLGQAAEENFVHICQTNLYCIRLALAQAAELKVDSTPVEGFENSVVDDILELDKWG